MRSLMPEPTKFLQGQEVDIQIETMVIGVQVPLHVHMNPPKVIIVLPVVPPPQPGVVVEAAAAEAVHLQGHFHVVAVTNDFQIQHIRAVK